MEVAQRLKSNLNYTSAPRPLVHPLDPITGAAERTPALKSRNASPNLKPGALHEREDAKHLAGKF